jgi:hypothetical protein
MNGRVVLAMLLLVGSMGESTKLSADTTVKAEEAAFR